MRIRSHNLAGIVAHLLGYVVRFRPAIPAVVWPDFAVSCDANQAAMGTDAQPEAGGADLWQLDRGGVHCAVGASGTGNGVSPREYKRSASEIGREFGSRTENDNKPA